jgi:hypothetical protein
VTTGPRAYGCSRSDLLVLARRTAGRNLSKDEWQTFLPGQPYFEVFPNLPIPKK